MHYLPLTAAAISDFERAIPKGSMKKRGAINFSLSKVLEFLLEPLRIIALRYGLVKLDSSIEEGENSMTAYAQCQQYVLRYLNRE